MAIKGGYKMIIHVEFNDTKAIEKAISQEIVYQLGYNCTPQEFMYKAVDEIMGEYHFLKLGRGLYVEDRNYYEDDFGSEHEVLKELLLPGENDGLYIRGLATRVDCYPNIHIWENRFNKKLTKRYDALRAKYQLYPQLLEEDEWLGRILPEEE